MKLPKPKKESIFYDDKKLYACLASYPLTKGHCVIVWKNKVKDLHLLNRKDYEYLMNKVDIIRNALLKTLKTNKVYLVYADEVEQVHWHLVPRYNEKGFNILSHKPSVLKYFSLASDIKNNL
jgi:diadenosine tetraphosphate (Ap4A) HIT family hydrolase